MQRIMVFAGTLLLFSQASAQFNYPVVRKEAFDTTVMGIRIQDPYFWMERKAKETELMEFCKQQGAFAENILNKVPGMEMLQLEMEEIYTKLQPEIWNLQTAGGYLYYNRDIPEEGPTLCRRKGVDGEEEKILRRVTINGQNYSIRKRVFAYNKPLLALMLTQKGEANPHIRIYNLDKKEFLPDSIAPVMFNDSRGVSMAWAPDDSGLFYTQAPPTTVHAEKYFKGKIKWHAIGTLAEKDPEIFGKDVQPTIQINERETPYIYSFANSPYLIARIRSGSGDNYAFAVHFSKIKGTKTPWIRLKNYINLGDAFDAKDNWLYAATTGPSNYKIVRINMATGAVPENFIAPQQFPIAGTDYRNNKAIIAGNDHLYVLLRKVGDMKILKADLSTGKTSILPIQEKTSLSQLMLFNENDLLYCQSSPVKSDLFRLYRSDLNQAASLPFASEVLDISAEFKSEVIEIPSRDGKKIPLTLLYASNQPLSNTQRPFLLEGYGNSGASTDLSFNPSYISWLKRGGVYAFAHVRGGGELGEDWYKDGQFPNKMNSVNDVVDIADYLVKNKYSDPSKMLVMGGSAGSFLVGNAINQRPDLFAGGIFLAGLPDLALHTDAAGAREEKSVGPKNTKEGYRSNYELSALYHIPDVKALPAMLIVHGATDYIISLSPAARYAAQYQEKQKGNRPALFLVEWEGGHMGAEGEIFYLLKFALWQTGHPEFQPVN